MKKLPVILLCLLCLTGCVKNLDNIPALSLVEELGEEWAFEKVEGYSRQALREIWGDPQRESCDGTDDVWFLDTEGDRRLTVCYDGEDKVESLLLHTAPGLEEIPTEPPVDEITGVAPLDGPTDPATMSGAPDLTVACMNGPILYGGQTPMKEVPALNGGLSWVTTMPDGTRGVLCADAMHPLEMQKYLTVLETAETSAYLFFRDGEGMVFPGEISVEAWSFDCTPDCDGLPFEVTTTGGGESVELLPGKYIYIVHTLWGDGETSGGRVTHIFAAERLYPVDE